jgi:hypothetical protein
VPNEGIRLLRGIVATREPAAARRKENGRRFRMECGFIDWYRIGKPTARSIILCLKFADENFETQAMYIEALTTGFCKFLSD